MGFNVVPEIRHEIEVLRDMLNDALESSTPELPKDQQAKRDLAQVKEIIDRHHDAGWLLGYHHEELGGFVYHYAGGR